MDPPSPRSKLSVQPEAEGSLSTARLSTAEGLRVDVSQAGSPLKVLASIEVPGSLGEGTKRNIVIRSPFTQQSVVALLNGGRGDAT